MVLYYNCILLLMEYCHVQVRLKYNSDKLLRLCPMMGFELFSLWAYKSYVRLCRCNIHF